MRDTGITADGKNGAFRVFDPASAKPQIDLVLDLADRQREAIRVHQRLLLGLEAGQVVGSAATTDT